jgi:catechol 2,3-dioxygenase-like lactoylglutathione lyase family enzyme
VQCAALIAPYKTDVGESQMKPRITVITIGVDDLERSLRFYRDGLGLKTEGTSAQSLNMAPWRSLICRLALNPDNLLAQNPFALRYRRACSSGSIPHHERFFISDFS